VTHIFKRQSYQFLYRRVAEFVVFLAVNVVTILTKLSPVPLKLLTSLFIEVDLKLFKIYYSDIFIVIWQIFCFVKRLLTFQIDILNILVFSHNFQKQSSYKPFVYIVNLQR